MNEGDFLYRKEVMTIILTQLLFGWTSDSYSLVYNNFLLKKYLL